MVELSNFDDRLHEDLRDPEQAVFFLEDALGDGIDEFLFALREVMKAQEGGVSRVARESRIGRENLYHSLSHEGNPRIRTLNAILDQLGLRLSVASKLSESRTDTVADEEDAAGAEFIAVPDR